MKHQFVYKFFIVVFIGIGVVAFQSNETENSYSLLYENTLKNFISKQQNLIDQIQAISNIDSNSKKTIQLKICQNRLHLKEVDFWLRYFEPTVYKKINGPLPVEWETEVFEKYEKPYRREGAGFTLAWQLLEEDDISKDSLLHLIQSAKQASRYFLNDSIKSLVLDPAHFFFCNRLYLLNLATLYTSGFECPDSKSILAELNHLATFIKNIYLAYNQSHSILALDSEYLNLYDSMLHFIEQNKDYASFDHFTFISEYVNPLFKLNQKAIRHHQLKTKSNVDYSLNNQVESIFSKKLYTAQNPKGTYRRISEAKVLNEIRELGKLLFYDPILSANNERSCASCHSSSQNYTDTILQTSVALNRKNQLSRNSPSLLNSPYNHLIMLDGKILTLQDQVVAVISNSLEMGNNANQIVKKVLDCKEYKKRFELVLKYCPEQKKIGIEHIASAITYYYSQFSNYYSVFDFAMNKQKKLDEESKKGFNLFMGKAQCATCHFAPQFNGVKPPYIGSEFEVLGVPSDTTFKKIDPDSGRHLANPAPETLYAFRTGSLKNISKTAPYMHNGVFKNLEQVIDFYDAGGGAGRGLSLPNQTLSSDSLHLSSLEKKQLILFMKSLTEEIPVETLPNSLPLSKNKTLNTRKVGGNY